MITVRNPPQDAPGNTAGPHLSLWGPHTTTASCYKRDRPREGSSELVSDIWRLEKKHTQNVVSAVPYLAQRLFEK